MTTLTRSPKQNTLINAAVLSSLLAALLVLSPAEATLGNIVKIVYAHGASERIASYAFVLAAVLGMVQLALDRIELAPWTRAMTETALAFWLAQFVISLPAQILAWGGLTWDEPRVVGSVWIMVLSVIIYVVALRLGDPSWMAFGAAANAAIVLVILRGSIDILHPLNPIVASDSMAIKLFYAAIVVVTGALAYQFAHWRADAARSTRRTKWQL